METIKRILYEKGVLGIEDIIRCGFLFADSEDGILLRGVDCDDLDFQKLFYYFYS